MPRARHPLPLEMWGIRYDPRSERYLLKEGSVTYALKIEHTRLLKAFIRANQTVHPVISKWYDSLDRATKRELHAEGLLSFTDDNFYPDPEPVYE